MIGDIWLMSGHMKVMSGHVEVMSGHVEVMSGHVEVMSGHVEVMSGHSRVKNVNIEKGKTVQAEHSTLDTGNIWARKILSCEMNPMNQDYYMPLSPQEKRRNSPPRASRKTDMTVSTEKIEFLVIVGPISGCGAYNCACSNYRHYKCACSGYRHYNCACSNYRHYKCACSGYRHYKCACSGYRHYNCACSNYRHYKCACSGYRHYKYAYSSHRYYNCAASIHRSNLRPILVCSLKQTCFKELKDKSLGMRGRVLQIKAIQSKCQKQKNHWPTRTWPITGSSHKWVTQAGHPLHSRPTQAASALPCNFLFVTLHCQGEGRWCSHSYWWPATDCQEAGP